MKAHAGPFAAVTLLIATLPLAADEPPKATPVPAPAQTSGNPAVNPDWKFKVTPNPAPIFAERESQSEPGAVKAAAPLFDFGYNTRLRRKGDGEPILVELPRVWWTGDFLTPLEKSRRVIPRSDRVRD